MIARCMAILGLAAFALAKPCPFAAQDPAKAPGGPGALVHPQPPQGTLPPNTALVGLREGDECIRLFAGMSGGPELQLRRKGKGRDARMHYYFHGVEVATFPRPVQITINLFADCKANAAAVSFVWPEFTRHLRFVYHWSFEAENGTAQSTRDVEPSNLEVQDSVWMEDSSTKNLEFTLPATGIPIGTHLIVEIFSGDHLLKTFGLHL